jgi:hypothetical protein
MNILFIRIVVDIYCATVNRLKSELKICVENTVNKKSSKRQQIIV